MLPDTVIFKRLEVEQEAVDNFDFKAILQEIFPFPEDLS
jgi:hypothetical protein